MVNGPKPTHRCYAQRLLAHIYMYTMCLQIMLTVMDNIFNRRQPVLPLPLLTTAATFEINCFAHHRFQNHINWLKILFYAACSNCGNGITNVSEIFVLCMLVFEISQASLPAYSDGKIRFVEHTPTQNRLSNRIHSYCHMYLLTHVHIYSTIHRDAHVLIYHITLDLYA